jgi:uncharacterized C2H2 Zn-finger protein
MARSRTQAKTEQTLTCPECGRTFTRAAALGAHRRQAHGVAGATAQTRKSRSTKRPSRTASRSTRTQTRAASQPRRRRTRSSSPGRGNSTGSVNRDQLLQTLFPNGIPATEAAIRAVNDWLDQAEELARMT